jgi:hypothetical protein
MQILVPFEIGLRRLEVDAADEALEIKWRMDGRSHA